MKGQMRYCKENNTFMDRQQVKLDDAEHALKEDAKNVERIDEADKTIEKLFNDNRKVVKDITQKQYNRVLDLVSKIELEEQKERLSIKLHAIKSALDSK